MTPQTGCHSSYSFLCLDFLESAEEGITSIAFFRTSWDEEGNFCGVERSAVAEDGVGFLLFEVDFGEASAVVEGIVPDSVHGAWNPDGCEGCAALEGFEVNLGQAVREFDGSEAGATAESKSANFSHAVRDFD